MSERQLLALREKNKELEKKLREMMIFAQENEALQQKVHQFITTLFSAHELPALQAMIPYLLRDIFTIPHTAMRLWQLPGVAETARLEISRGKQLPRRRANGRRHPQRHRATRI